MRQKNTVVSTKTMRTLQIPVLKVVAEQSLSSAIGMFNLSMPGETSGDRPLLRMIVNEGLWVLLCSSSYFMEECPNRSQIGPHCLGHPKNQVISEGLW